MTKSVPFYGFEHPDANYIYCPNQFFDVCLPHCSRGAVRFVAYLLRRILGWRDENGDPIEENISVPYQDFIDKAGISKGAIGSVSDEVIARGLVCRTQRGKAKSKGSAGQTATYTLRWDERGEYLTDPNMFQGFYAGGGHCSPIPNAFFDQVMPSTRLCVTKVVGTVLRYTVGFENRYGGGRRPQAPLSLTFIQQYANIKDRTAAVDAVKDALEENFIRRIHEGSVRGAAVYAPTWLDKATNAVIGSKRLPGKLDRFKTPTNDTSIGSKRLPGERFKTPTTINTENKDISKQQQVGEKDIPNSAAAELSKSIQMLCGEGFDKKTAQNLAEIASFNEIQKQIVWIDLRKHKNRLGMLRIAIVQKWAVPTGVKESEAKQHSREREQEQDAMRAACQAAIDDEVRRYNKRRKALLADWRHQTAEEQNQYHSEAIAKATTDFDRTQLRRHTDLNIPPMATLEIMALIRILL